MRFDANTLTVEEPALLLGDTSYPGRVLSIVEWFSFKSRLDEQWKRETDEGDQRSPETYAAAQALMLEFLRAVFPGDEPIATIERRGTLAVATTFTAFFGHQLYALGLVPQLNQKTNGTNSPSKTTSEPSANESDSGKN